MQYRSLAEFLNRGGKVLAKGPVALIFAEDAVELDSTIAHHLQLGFRSVVLFAPDGLVLPAADVGAGDKVSDAVHHVTLNTLAEGAVPAAVNAVIAAAPGTWFYYGYNAEYLFYPFSETRNVREMLAFHIEERRDAMIAYVVDLYAADLSEHPDAVDLEQAYFDTEGYYALGRGLPDGMLLDRQYDFFGGLRWRYEEHVPWTRRKIDRIALFKAQKGLHLQADHTFDVPEYNTFSCPWHHNLTAAICSFRTAKALKANPGSTYAIRSFMWKKSEPFTWTSRQLLDLGLMEPGQWF